jgi:uncharacterized protein (TIGR03083 family)
MTATGTEVAAAISRTSPARARELDAAQFDAMLRLLEGLPPDSWNLPTDCAAWSVRDLVAHIVGNTEGSVSPARMVRDIAVSLGRHPRMGRLDALNQVQVEDRSNCSGAQLTRRLAYLRSQRLRLRTRLPKIVRRLPLPPGFSLPAGQRQVGYALDVIYIRDLWMHRVDICVATGRDLVLGEHDHEVVRQVIADLARTWDGPAVILELTGPAGGRWQLGSTPDRQPSTATVATARADTVDYLRCLSGRNDTPQLTIEGDETIRRALHAARVIF